MKKYCCELWIGWFRSDFCCKYCLFRFKIWNANPKETLQCSYLVLNSKYCLEAISSTKNKQHIFSTRLTAPRNERNACFSQLVFLLMPPLSLAMLLLSSIYRLQNKIRFEFTSYFDFSKFSWSNSYPNGFYLLQALVIWSSKGWIRLLLSQFSDMHWPTQPNSRDKVRFAHFSSDGGLLSQFKD